MAMFVTNRMTPNPIVITSITTVADASEIMRKNRIRRLPVVDGGKLVGIITDRDLREVSPSSATTLSIFELNYLLAKMKVKDVMKRNVLTITADATIEEAALIMYKEKIGGLIVLDNNGKVCGVITETDIFKCFVDLMGLPQGKTRITLDVTDKIGLLHKVTGVFKDMGINIGSLVSRRVGEGQEAKNELVIRADVENVEALTEKLAENGFPILHIAQIG
jgi:acetoin utilization protein AcuB